MMLRAGLWAFAGKGGHQVVNFALVIILARLLTPEAFGIVAAAQVVLVLSQVVVKFGLGAALIQTDRLTRSMERTALTLMLGMALVMAGAIHLATPWLARLMTIPELVEVMPVMLLTFLLSAATNPGMNLLMRDMRFKLLAAIDVGTFALLHAVIAVALALAGWSYWAIILATLASTAAKAVIVWSIRPVGPTLKMQRDEVKALLGFGSGLFLAQMGSNLAQRVDNVVVANAFGAAALGFYSRAFNILDLTNALLGSAFRDVLFSGFSNNRRDGSGSVETKQRAFLRAHAFAAFLILPISVLSVTFAASIVLILLGESWLQAVPILQVLALGMYFRLGYKLSGALLLSEGELRRMIANTLTFSFATLVGATLGSLWSIIGVAWGVLAALLLHFYLMTGGAMAVINVSWLAFLRYISPFFVATLFALAAFQFSKVYLQQVYSGYLLMVFAPVIFYTAYIFALYIMRKASSVRHLIEGFRASLQ